MPPNGQTNGQTNNQGVPPQNDDVSSLKRAQDRLYSPTAATDFRTPSLSVSTQVPGPAQVWERPVIKVPKKHISVTAMFFLGALGFFILAAGISAIFVLMGSRLVSNSNITITVQGPTTIASGTAVPLVITMTNHNPAAISNADISLSFPDGTRSADDVTQPLVRYTDTLGTLAPGATQTRTVQAVLFGSANQTVTIPVTFTYRTANSNAVFTKQQNYTFTITSAPLTLSVNSTSSVASGQPISLSIVVRSNASTPLSNIAVVAQYPFGFTPKAAVNASSTGSFINIGTLQPGQEKDIIVQGTLAGSNSTQLAFQFTVGTAATDGTPSLSVPYASQQTQVTISKPFLAVSLSLNNSNTNPIVVPSGQPISGIITWVNSLTSSITNGIVTIKLSGTALNPASVTTSNGYYDSSKQTLTFSSQTEPGLGNLGPGDTGNGSFTLGTKTGAALNSLNNPSIQLAVSVSGQHNNDGTTESINNTLTQTIELSTNLQLVSSIVHSSGPFSNTGPLPTVPNQATTYTVLWSVSNTINDVGGGTVTAILPSYVTFTGQVNPNDGSLSYNATNHTVTWNIGDVPAGTITKPLQAAFQVSFTPSVSQSNTSPILVGNQNLVGQDRYTHTQVGNIVDALSIQTPNDSGYQPTFGNVGN